MFCSGVPAASCRTTAERDGQQSQWPDKSHFCELTLTQRVFCRFAVVIFTWLTHFCVVVKTMTQTIKEKTRPLEDLCEKLNYSACKGTVCNKTWRNRFEVHRVLNIFVDFLPPPPARRDQKISGVYQLIHRNHTGTQCTQYIVILRTLFIRTVTVIKRTNRRNRKWSHWWSLVVVRGFRTSPRMQLLYDLKSENLQIHFEWWNKWSLITLKA